MDDMFAASFVKDPMKQNYTEKIAEQLLQVKHLPNISMSFTKEGELCPHPAAENSKTVDFIKDFSSFRVKYI